MDGRNDKLASIHAPARGATVVFQRENVLLIASIHAPARGATLSMLIPMVDELGFNPRSRTGSDH